jgi:ketosteroid isomerase-like protein
MRIPSAVTRGRSATILLMAATLAAPAFVAAGSSNPEERAVKRTIAAWDRAWIAGDGEAFCDPLTPRGRDLVERYYIRKGRCEQIFERIGRSRRNEPRGRVRRIGVDGNFAIALNEFVCRGSCRGFEMVLALKRLGGRWLIDYPGPGAPRFSTLPTGGAGEPEATEVAVRYVRAEHELDGETACSLLTPRSRNRLDRNFNRGCVWLYEHSSVENARVRQVHVVGDLAVANVKPTNDNFTHQILMLVELPIGWRVERIHPGLP